MGDVDPDRSFERLYRCHRRDVYGTVLKDVRDPDEAEDVTQVAFLNAYRAMRRGDEPEKPKAWLLAIARNVVRRRAGLRAERPQEVELDAELMPAVDGVEGSASQDIGAALRTLTDAQREAILLREIQGLSYAEIAEALVLSVPAVEALLFRARRALADELALADRAPVVRRQRGRGLMAIPGLAKLGSFGFSTGRIATACLVGCAAIATMPVGDRDAAGESARAARAPAHRVVHPVASSMKRAPLAVKTKTVRKHRPAKSGSAAAQGSQPTQSSTESTSTTLLPVQLPPVSVPTAQAPPLPELPKVPELPPLPPPLSSLTS